MTYISVNSHIIRRNAKTGGSEPPVRVARCKSDRDPIYAHSVKIEGPSRLVYHADRKILNCGARLVLVTSAPVKVLR